ncbi:thioredoxin domain-containing protein [Microbacterium esteraromaticum]|uniref:Thioredoxin domain-containing protein n=2 Tax=Microbacterium esteraromaticum TaxID=57043 RepID=A0A939ISE6_9MICO|nr:thioredoxin domain-containing protein [Microbacterium esteraromaticum]MBN8206795.1 thioredoxin domain-containing protein [Microbacterium esteraromaticum]MBN8416950.1 thioredoxin domain-containing protein [Microbacterium esteraromaticum]
MSSDETPNVPTTRNSRDAVRNKAQQVRAQQSRARVMRRIIIGVVAIVAVGSIGTAVAYTVGSSISKPELSPLGMDADGVTVSDVTLAPGDGATPTPEATASEAGNTATPTPDPTETASGPTEIHVYVDYLSAAASEFERANARQLATWIEQGAVTVTYHPVAMLTASSNGTKYSLRAASAAACVATYSQDQFYDYNHELLTDQPEIDTDGRTDMQLADLAVAVGVENPKQVRECIEQQDFVKWAKGATTRALEGPLPGSKDLKLTNEALVVVEGKAYVGAMGDPAEFSQFVLTTASDQYFGATQPTPTPTPVPTTTPTS